MSTENWGGSRPSSGRKSKFGEKTVAVRIPVSWLQEEGIDGVQKKIAGFSEYHDKLSEQFLIDYSEVLPLVINLRSQGLSMQKIANELNQAGYLTREKKPFSSVQVLRILRRACEIDSTESIAENKSVLRTETDELQQNIDRLVQENQRLHKELMSVNRNQRKAISTKLRFQVFQRDGFRCKCCGKIAGDGVELQVDHIQPVAKGGINDLQNLQTLCRECNSGKRTETVDFEEVKAVVPVVTTKPASPLKSNFKQKPITQSLF